jgi:hypothetical protein
MLLVGYIGEDIQHRDEDIFLNVVQDPSALLYLLT